MTEFKKMSGTYEQIGDFLIPNLALPPQETQPIGVWGERVRWHSSCEPTEPTGETNGTSNT